MQKINLGDYIKHRNIDKEGIVIFIKKGMWGNVYGIYSENINNWHDLDDEPEANNIALQLGSNKNCYWIEDSSTLLIAKAVNKEELELINKLDNLNHEYKTVQRALDVINRVDR